jgi:Sigma-70, region 4
LLKPEARALLIKRYVEDSPIAEVAARIGVHSSVVAMRLQRGKIALRRILTTELRHELAPYRMGDTTAWEQTRVWCARCGQHKLLARSIQDESKLWVRCPTCCPTIEHFLIYTRSASLLDGVKGYKRAFSRIYSWVNDYYRPHLCDRMVRCCCGNMTSLRPGRLEGERTFPTDQHSLHYRCELCGTSGSESLETLVFALPVMQNFCQQHPRIRFLPSYEVEVDGHAAIVTGFTSVTSQESIAVISASDTYEVLRWSLNH